MNRKVDGKQQRQTHDTLFHAMMDLLSLDSERVFCHAYFHMRKEIQNFEIQES